MPEFPVTLGVGPGGPSPACWADRHYTNWAGDDAVGSCEDTVDPERFELGLCRRHHPEIAGDRA